MKEIKPEDIWNKNRVKGLSDFILLHKLIKNTPNDQELGAKIRKLFNNEN